MAGFYNNFNQMNQQSQQVMLHNTPPMEEKEEVLQQVKSEEKSAIMLIPVENDNNLPSYESQFLDLQPQMMDKLQKIEESKQLQPPTSSQKSSHVSTLTQVHSGFEEQRVDEAMIKRQFVHKLKKWQRERQQLKLRKEEIQLRKSKQREEMRLQKERQLDEEREFLRLQKQKQLQQKIQEIEERRQMRGKSLKNASLQQSYQKLPSYAEQQVRYKQQIHEEIQINIKLLKNKKQLSKLDPQELKLHEQAYIQKIKQRLNIISKPQKHEKAKSDFNLYLKRNDDKKQAELMKIIKMKKYQQKINQIPIKISEQKKEEKLIEIDKIKNPQKYRLLANKLLNDQQIYEQFKDFEININRKEIGINYLKQLKQNHEKTQVRAKRSNSQMIRNNPEERLPKINKKYEQTAKTVIREQTNTKSVQMLPSQSYKISLDRNKERDSRYMKALKQKLQQAIDL